MNQTQAIEMLRAALKPFITDPGPNAMDVKAARHAFDATAAFTDAGEPPLAAVAHWPQPVIPPALADIARGRDHLTTAEFARATNRACQTIRKNYHMDGSCFGIRPVKVGNRLLWPVAAVAKLLHSKGQ